MKTFQEYYRELKMEYSNNTPAEDFSHENTGVRGGRTNGGIYSYHLDSPFSKGM